MASPFGTYHLAPLLSYRSTPSRGQAPAGIQINPYTFVTNWIPQQVRDDKRVVQDDMCDLKMTFKWDGKEVVVVVVLGLGKNLRQRRRKFLVAGDGFEPSTFGL